MSRRRGAVCGEKITAHQCQCQLTHEDTSTTATSDRQARIPSDLAVWKLWLAKAGIEPSTTCAAVRLLPLHSASHVIERTMGKQANEEANGFSAAQLLCHWLFHSRSTANQRRRDCQRGTKWL
ncbi:hypothetical protein Y032_0106g3729 [Ancylostoma ceylanicum]|uniref:Uncharacterized protein n=1 Tax=Ancylostoma ceylanicum TaxID=53326 RepID=A0A016TFN5_9BILA|nr:hypothetical protein Y032_0106g3729 [Ancylostoma ceylanicum]